MDIIAKNIQGNPNALALTIRGMRVDTITATINSHDRLVWVGMNGVTYDSVGTATMVATNKLFA